MMLPIFSYGKNCKDQKEPLQTISIDDLYQFITNTTSSLVQETQTLRKIYAYNKESYRNLKTTLPYVSCSIFDLGYRKYEYFKSSCGWILDIDLHTPDTGLYNSLIKDDRITLMYTSPSGVGLKLIILFDHAYTDKIKYAQAYKEFARSFGLQYGILEYIDMKNCDVSRISFLCHDPICHYNPSATTISPVDYHPVYDTVIPNGKKATQELTPIVYKEIMQLLEIKPKISYQPPYVPDEIKDLINPLASFLSDHKINVINHDPVQYGIKIKAACSKDKGEIILYKGKKGFSIVTSARKDLSHELNETLKHLIIFYLNNAATP